MNGSLFLKKFVHVSVHLQILSDMSLPKPNLSTGGGGGILPKRLIRGNGPLRNFAKNTLKGSYWYMHCFLGSAEFLSACVAYF